MKKSLEKELKKKFSGLEIMEDPIQWERISKRIHRRSIQRKYAFFLMAASICALFISVIFVFYNKSQSNTEITQSEGIYIENSEQSFSIPEKNKERNTPIQKENTKDQKKAEGFKINKSYIKESNSTKNKERFVVMSTESETKEFLLQDSSTVMLNAGSKLRVPTLLKSDRVVYLEGEGYFNVQKHPNSSFKVVVGEIIIEVIGTEFNIKENDKTVQILVTHGVVNCYLKNNPGSLIVLNSNEMALFDGEHLQKGTADINSLYWKTKSLVFEQAPLGEVLNVMKENFGSGFSSIDPNLLNCHVTFKVRDPNPEKILKILKSIGTLDYIKDKNDFKLSGKGCK